MASQSRPTAELQRAAEFRTALRRFLRRTKVVTDDSGLTPERYDLLLMIAATEGEVRLTDLCRLLELRQTAVSELVKRAVEAGLVVKDPSPDDRRAVSLRLSRDGDRRLMRAFRALGEDRDELVATFAAANRQLRRTS
ncbi:MAG TPA: MarR family transcriptional regulator [Gaiellaceae bacterium]|nr:MarR family transcriptional regulator [Gaiellaceae bacterium]